MSLTRFSTSSRTRGTPRSGPTRTHARRPGEQGMNCFRPERFWLLMSPGRSWSNSEMSLARTIHLRHTSRRPSTPRPLLIAIAPPEPSTTPVRAVLVVPLHTHLGPLPLLPHRHSPTHLRGPRPSSNVKVKVDSARLPVESVSPRASPRSAYTGATRPPRPRHGGRGKNRARQTQTALHSRRTTSPMMIPSGRSNSCSCRPVRSRWGGRSPLGPSRARSFLSTRRLPGLRAPSGPRVPPRLVLLLPPTHKHSFGHSWA